MKSGNVLYNLQGGGSKFTKSSEFDHPLKSDISLVANSYCKILCVIGGMFRVYSFDY